MDRDIKTLVAKLYADDKHRLAIDRIIASLPTLTDCFDEISAALTTKCSERWPNKDEKLTVKMGQKERWLTCIYFEPHTFQSEEWKVRFPTLQYCLVRPSDLMGNTKFEIGQPIQVVIWAICERDEHQRSVGVLRQAIANSTHVSYFPRSRGTKWQLIWCSMPIEMIDLGKNDKESCINELYDALDKTYDELRLCLSRPTVESSDPIAPA